MNKIILKEEEETRDQKIGALHKSKMDWVEKSLRYLKIESLNMQNIAFFF